MQLEVALQIPAYFLVGMMLSTLYGRRHLPCKTDRFSIPWKKQVFRVRGKPATNQLKVPFGCVSPTKIPTFQPTNPSMDWSVQEEKIPRSRGAPARGQKKAHMGPCGWEASSCPHARWVCVPETNSRQGILRDPFSMCSWGGESCAVRCHRKGTPRTLPRKKQHVISGRFALSN